MQENSAAAPFAQEAPAGRIIYQSSRAIVFHGPWQGLNLPPKSVDVVLTDPPYTEHVQANVRSCSTNGKVKVKTYELKFDPLAGYEHVPAFLAIARRWVLNFCALEQLGAYETAAGGPYKAGGSYVRSGIWRKQQAAPQLSGDRPANSCEGWALMHEKPESGRLTWTGHGKHAYLSSHLEDKDRPGYVPADEDVPNFVQCQRERGAKRHPAQKPRALCDQLAQWFVPRPIAPIGNQIVLDAYAGSGALGLAALRMGATVIFCEIDAEWAEYIAGEVRFLLEGAATISHPDASP